MNLQTIKDTSGKDEYVLVPMPLFEAVRGEIDRKLKDPFLRALFEAPIDDEPETDEERVAVAKAKEDIKQGRTMSHTALKRQLKRRAS